MPPAVFSRREFLHTATAAGSGFQSGRGRRAAAQPAAAAPRQAAEEAGGRDHRLLLPLARLPHLRPLPARLPARRPHALPRLRHRRHVRRADARPGDLSRELSRKHGFPLYPDIAGALTLGGDKLAVDGVLLIGEHGDYPYNASGQKLYPRYEFFQKIVEVFRKSGRSVPVFCDKHLSYDRTKARAMVDTARKHGLPADGRLEPAGHLAPARSGTAARRRRSRKRWSPRAASWRSLASTPWKRSSAWSSAAPEGPAGRPGRDLPGRRRGVEGGRRGRSGRGNCWSTPWAAARR